MKKLALLVSLIAVVTTPSRAQQRAPQNDSIRKEDLGADLFFLAGDSLRGRLTDTEGNRAAADFIKSRFERMGLKPAAAGNSYYQSYDLMTATLADGNALEVGGADAVRQLRSGQEFYPHRYSASGGVARKPVVFVGFGIDAPELGYDDYRGTITGKIVLALDHEPGERDPNSPFDGVITSEWATAWRKALTAQEKGAVAVLFVADVHNHAEGQAFETNARNYWPERPPRILNYTLAAWADRIRIPVAQISPALASSLIAGTNTTLEQLSKSAETPRGFAPVDLPRAAVGLHTAVDRHIVPDRNVVAYIEGSDARLKDEWVLVTAHYDHNGADATQVFNGADDNGSGVVALIEIAEAYALAAKDGQRPRRSVLFAAWNSEERGLLGAWAYTERPLAPLAAIAAVLNMDMIGRNEEVPIGGGARFNGLAVQTAESNENALNLMAFSRVPDITAAVEKANAAIGLELKKRYDNNSSQLLRRSDQWPFLQRGVPAMGFITGLHPDYHTQYDRPEKINYVKMEKIARLVHQVSWDIANADARPRPPGRRSTNP